MSRPASNRQFWVLFGILFALIAFEGSLALWVLADFKKSVSDLRTMQNAGMKVDEFGLQLNNFVKEMKVSTGIGQQGSSQAPLPPTTALVDGARVLGELNAQVRSTQLGRLLAGVSQLRAAVESYGQLQQRRAHDEATMAYIQTIEPLADRLASDDFPATRTAILADVARVSEANRAAGVSARRMLLISLLATLAVGLVLARLISASLRRAAQQDRELQRRASELAIARSIQTSVLPKNLTLSGFDVGALMITADEVGGDFYEFRPLHDGGAWLAMGDVTGHGLQAGLVMLMAQSMFALLSEEEQGEPSPRRLFSRLNRSLYLNLRDRLGEDRFMTMVVARVFPDGRMVYAGAHTDLLVYRAKQQSVERIATQGLWLGLVEDVSALTRDEEITLQPGDIALFHTDGVTEARNAEGRMFDVERLAGQLKQWSAGSAAETVRHIADTTREWAAATADDLSLMAIKRR
jgi:serine phosphatase RsbU (regulator of sigma subunit)